MAWKPNPDCSTHYIGGSTFLFRPLDDSEEEEFRQYARECAPDSTTIEKWSIYHPVCRDEWEKRGIRP